MRANIRLAFGLAALPAILLQNNLIGILIQTIYVIILAVLHGRRFRALPNLILLLSVSAAHILQPNGLLLFTIGSFPVTLGALLIGSRKACTLIALLYLSHYMVSGKPRFPGRIGSLVSLQFTYFDAISTTWHTITPKRPLIGAIDTLLLRMSETRTPAPLKQEQTRVPLKTLLIEVIHPVILWALFLLGSEAILPILI